MRASDGRVAFGAFMGGLGLGVIVSLLFAPHSGEETRRSIARKARQTREFAGDAADLVGDAVATVGEAVGDLRGQMADTVENAKSRLRGAVQVGKDAYQEQLGRRQ
jgi:gas vesicle protein